MTRVLLLLSLFVISLLCFTSLAAAGPLETCVQAALKGPEKKKVKVLGYHFNCKPVDILRLEGGKLKVAGQLSHHLTGRPDDQIYYAFTVNTKAKTYDSLEISIQPTPLAGALGQLVAVTATTQGAPISPDQATKFFREAEQLRVGNWQQAANVIIGGVAVKLAEKGQP
jgi:hypothetical protein